MQMLGSDSGYGDSIRDSESYKEGDISGGWAADWTVDSPVPTPGEVSTSGMIGSHELFNLKFPDILVADEGLSAIHLESLY